MRTSKISKETTRIFSAIPRSTRASRSTPGAPKELHRDRDLRAIKVENETQTTVWEELESAPLSPAHSDATTVSKKRKRAPNVSAGTAPSESPKNWEEVYNLTKEMRRTLIAPVDTMGCERLFDPTASERDQRFQTLVSLMLSSQTKDQVTAAAVSRMKTELPGGLCLESILAVRPEDLDELIGKVGFHNTKTKHIKMTAEILRDKWNGDIPDSIEGLVGLPGVGPKMAHLTMSAAWGRTVGIGVDVHVHRITNLWGWHKTKTPEETRKALEAWLPKEKWHEINSLLVGFGQVLCTPVARKCGDCVLAQRRLCPGSLVKRKLKRDAKIEVAVKEDAIDIVEEIKLEEAESLVDENQDIEDFGRKKSLRRR